MGTRSKTPVFWTPFPIRTPARSRCLNLLHMLPVTCGYDLVSKSDDAARSLETQLRLLTDHSSAPRRLFVRFKPC